MQSKKAPQKIRDINLVTVPGLRPGMPSPNSSAGNTARSSGKPRHPGRMPGPTRPKPPPVKAALLGIPKNVIFARVIL